MIRITKLSMLAIALATLGTSVNAASAGTWWQYNHPRRAEVNDRLAYQNFRINHGVATGQITPYQAYRLHTEDRAIHGEERFFARVNGGYITPGEQRLLNRQENVVSKQIGP